MYALCSNKFQQIQFQLWHVVLTIFRSRPGPLLSPQLGMPAMGPPLGHPGTSDSIPLRWTCLSRTKLVTCFALFCCIDILYIIYILYYNFDNIYIYIHRDYRCIHFTPFQTCCLRSVLSIAHNRTLQWHLLLLSSFVLACEHVWVFWAVWHGRFPMSRPVTKRDA